MTRSMLIREVETDLQNARARAMLRQPKFAGKTYTEVKAERQARKRKLVSYLLAAVWIIALALCLYEWVMR